MTYRIGNLDNLIDNVEKQFSSFEDLLRLIGDDSVNKDSETYKEMVRLIQRHKRGFKNYMIIMSNVLGHENYEEEYKNLLN